MGLLDNLVNSFSEQVNEGGIGITLLRLLASEGGRGATARASDYQSPAGVSGGLNELVQRLKQSGLGDVVQSWIGAGPNQQISADGLHQAIGPETVDRLSQQTGMSHARAAAASRPSAPTHC
jgi:uncharacterized protein YidB (DUF937 family)